LIINDGAVVLPVFQEDCRVIALDRMEFTPEAVEPGNCPARVVDKWLNDDADDCEEFKLTVLRGITSTTTKGAKG